LTSNRFFIKDKPPDTSQIFLEGNEHHHLSKVARIKPGDFVWLFDDSGMQYRACVQEIKKERTRLLILEAKQKPESKFRAALAQVMLKTKKMEQVIQKATELGAHDIWPIISDRTVVKMEKERSKKMDRWKRIMVEAAKQSGRSVLPLIHPPTELNDFITRKERGKKFFLSERGGILLRDILMSPLVKGEEIPESASVLVGPEGGWTESEEQDIMRNQYEAVSLGRLTLRSETAAIVGLAMVSQFWKDQHVS
jgi:16S rRNA (uracil1498-N3)-methyltransferase